MTMNIIERYELFGSILPSDTGVYAISNKLNGKLYIGSASRVGRYTSCSGFNDRFNSTGGHRKRLATNVHHSKKLQSAFNAYIREGIDINECFEILILEYCSSGKCIEREQWYFDNYKPWYNSVLIAGSTLGYKHTNESKEKIAKIHRGKSISLEHRNAVSTAQKGKALPDWHRQKLIESNKNRGRTYLGVSPSGEEFIFRGANGFAKNHNLQPSHITACARGENDHHKGWKFSYYEENE